MARPTSAARRYAEAVMEIARRDGTLDAWLLDLRTAAATVSHPDAVRTVDNPAVPLAARREILAALLGDRISSSALNLVLLLGERGRLAVLPALTREYARLLDRERGVVAATVTTAMPLSADELAAITDRLRAMTGSEVDVTTQVDPALIGGLTVRVGDRLIDASVRGRLVRLRDSLVAGAR